jgi:serine/threonine protein kinase/WD40 repeat protein
MKNHPLGDWKGKMIGRYQLAHLLGRGGMSEVWLATDTQLRRQVALKILPIAANDQSYLQDFAYEARAAASLEHAHILEVHDFGEQEIGPGEVIPYLVMPYVPGGTLADRLSAAQGPLSIQESLRYLRQAAQAIDYAHSKHILHRDIKPANMLLRDDWLLLADFGIAKALSHSMARNQTYAGSGTPEYMAPEQISGQATAASDRYSLAVVAYQLFTGRQPFRGATPYETISMQLQAPLPSPRQFNPQIPLSVEHLLSLALSRDPEKRPPSCIVFVNALQEAWMKGVQAEPDPEATLLAPWSKRLQSAPLPQPVSGAASSPSHPALPTHPVNSPGVTPVLPGMVATPRPGQSNGSASTLTDTGSTSTDPFATAGTTYTSPPRLMEPGPLERKIGRRPLLIGGAVVAAATIAGGVFALEALRSHNPAPKGGLGSLPTPAPGPRKLIAGVPLLALTGHTDEVWTASWSPAGRYLLTAGKDGNLMLWDITTALQHSVIGSTLATPTRNWKVAGIKFANLVDTVCWSRDGQRIVVGGDFTDKLYVLDAFGSSDTPTIYDNVDATNTGNGAIYSNVFAGPQKNNFSAINSNQVQVWSFGQTDQPQVNYDTGQQELNIGKASWSRDGKTMAAVSSVLSATRQLLLWTGSNHSHPQIFNLPARDKQLTFFTLADTVAWSPVDPHLLLISDGDITIVWDVQQGRAVLTIGANADPSTPVIGLTSWSPNGRYVAASYDALGDGSAQSPLANPQIFVWDIQTLLKSGTPGVTQQPTLTFKSPGGLQHSQSILDLEWSPDGRYLATSSLDKTVLIWKVDAG